MMIVYHAEVRDSSLRVSLGFGVTADSMINMIDSGVIRFSAVAKLKTNSAETAFRLTNSIENPWYENEVVTKLFSGDSCRSTSVGDVVYHEVDKKFFICCPVGWQQIDYNIALHAQVFESLDNAVDNSEHFADELSAEEMVEDMLQFDASVENEKASTLLPHVAAWRNSTTTWSAQ